MEIIKLILRQLVLYSNDLFTITFNISLDRFILDNTLKF